ncbi:MurR/RpiR family transcriptional regulator [Companilactobacillus kimchii]|uniref:MurR/RpiR family transcriptional regulator n=1 Tax=Companilactobacillus kimchii TaxID=2801452 RepID=UPI0006CFE2A4|nr:MurR/RpiR family transcriptional regulator [Companilactobacillus kimchii]
MDNFIKMIDYLNTHPKNDSYSKIIIYSFNNSNELAHLSITDIATNCYVSISTVSRFARVFDFKSFAEFKSYITIYSNISPDFSFRIKNSDLGLIRNNPKQFLMNYKEKIDASLTDVITNINISKIDEVLSMINSHDNVYVFGSESSYSLLNEIQRGLFISGKLIFQVKKLKILREWLLT